MIALEREQYPLVDIRHDSRWESIEYDPHIGEHEPTRLLPYLEPGNRVLEIGCGYGNVVARLARPDLDLRVVGVDINVRAIHTAAEKLKNLGDSVKSDEVLSWLKAARSDAAHPSAARMTTG